MGLSRAPSRRLADLIARLQAALADRYTIERELGRGGMATVYLAQDRKHHRRVAIKILKPELAAALGPERFLREIEIAAGLTHPHILPLHDSGEAGGLLYYVMPLVEGQTLRGRLEREKQLPLEDALAITRDIAEALSYAHSHSVVHRDIKPENILFQVGHAVVSDFGIARAITAAAGGRLTETGIAIGTPGYMSPEQASGREPVDGRSDLYSLGCVLYEMLAGEPPFTGPSAESIVRQHLSAPPPRVSAMRAAVTPAVEQAIARALAKTPADRFATAALFADALGAGAGAPQAPRRLSRTGVALALSAALVTIAGAVLFTYGKRAPALDANLLAIAPFDVLDRKLDLWREGLVDVLSRDMDGAGTLHVVPLSVVLRRWQGHADAIAAADLGRRTRAGLALFGTVALEGPDSMRLRGLVLDVASGKTLIEIERSDQTDRIDRLADSVTLDVLRDVRAAAPVGHIRLSAAGTKSLPALRAFLRGEQFSRRLSLDSAIGEYERAVALDSGFALALNHLGSAHSWNLEDAGPLYLKAGRHNHGLAPRDSLLITADSLGAATEDTLDHAYWSQLRRAFATLEEAVRLYPDDPMAWYQLAELRFHGGFVMGSTPWQALEAFERTIALDSTFAAAYFHLVQLALAGYDTARARRYVTSYLALTAGVPEGEGIGLVALLLDPRRAQSSELRRLLDTASARMLYYAWGVVWFWPDSAETAIRLARLLAAGGHVAAGGPVVGPATDTGFAKGVLEMMLSYRGHLHESYALLGNRAGVVFADLALAGAVPPDTAGAVFSQWLHSAAEEASVAEARWMPRCHRTLGAALWWASQRDTASLLALVRRDSLAARKTSSVPAIQGTRGSYQLARAALALARQDTTEALRRFAMFPDSLCPGHVSYGADAASSFLPLIRFRLLHATGRDREAVALLDSDLPSISPSWVLGVLDAGRIAERLGDRPAATRCYRFVTEVWRNADRELQPHVAEARAALRRLSGEPR